MASKIWVEATMYLLEQASFPTNNAALGISNSPSGNGVMAIKVQDGVIAIFCDDDFNQVPDGARLLVQPGFLVTTCDGLERGVL